MWRIYRNGFPLYLRLKYSRYIWIYKLATARYFKLKNRKPQKQSSFISVELPHLVLKGRRFHFLTLLFVVVVIFFVVRSSLRTIENFRLAQYGRIVKAVVTNTEKVGGKGTVSVTFKYVVSGREFLRTMSNEPYQIADSVYLLYLEGSPEISRTYRFISENYSTEIRLPQ